MYYYTRRFLKLCTNFRRLLCVNLFESLEGLTKDVFHKSYSKLLHLINACAPYQSWRGLASVFISMIVITIDQ